MFKKVVSVFLCILMLLSTLGVCASAVSISNGLWSLRSQFRYGIGPSSGSGIAMDYEYFSPVKSGDNTKYPLVIWVHGLFSGSLPGQQVTHNDIAYWTSDEFQARFTGAGGAFVLAPRSTEVLDVWDESNVTQAKETIDYFISKFSGNIDTTRIYLGGLSTGGKMVYQLAMSYPEMFAAIFPCSPTYTLSATDCQKLKNMPIWLLASSQDERVSPLVSKTSWERLSKVTQCPTDSRYSNFTKMYYPDGKTRVDYDHDTWYACTYDMFMENNEPYMNMSTVDAYGNMVNLQYPDGMISWLCQYRSSYMPDHSSNSGVTTNIYRFVMGIALSVVSYFVIKLRIL